MSRMASITPKSTAAPQLDVGIHAPPVHFGLDHTLHVANGVDHAEIDVAAEDEGTQNVQQLLPVGRLARDGPRLDHGVALPLARLTVVVVLHDPEADGQRARFAEGAQTHVHAEDETLFGLPAQQIDELAPKVNVEEPALTRTRHSGRS